MAVPANMRVTRQRAARERLLQQQQQTTEQQQPSGGEPMAVEPANVAGFQLDPLSQRDPQLCHHYTKEIYSYLRTLEMEHRVSPHYMQSQRDINATMRGILIDWLVEVAEEYRLEAETLYLAVNYIDRFLSQVPVNRSKLQLVGVTCMLVAAKYEEIHPPAVDEFVYISDNTYKVRAPPLITPRCALLSPPRPRCTAGAHRLRTQPARRAQLFFRSRPAADATRFLHTTAA